MIELQVYLAPDWCAASRRMSESVVEVSKESHKGVRITPIDVETEWGVDMSCKYGVRNVPTILVVKNGKVLDRVKGKRTKSEIKDIVERDGNDFK